MGKNESQIEGASKSLRKAKNCAIRGHMHSFQLHTLFCKRFKGYYFHFLEN